MTERESLGTADEIRQFVYLFYDRVRKDEQLGPVFDHHIHDWNAHLEKMVQFWSAGHRHLQWHAYAQARCIA